MGPSLSSLSCNRCQKSGDLGNARWGFSPKAFYILYCIYVLEKKIFFLVDTIANCPNIILIIYMYSSIRRKRYHTYEVIRES